MSLQSASYTLLRLHTYFNRQAVLLILNILSHRQRFRKGTYPQANVVSWVGNWPPQLVSTSEIPCSFLVHQHSSAAERMTPSYEYRYKVQKACNLQCACSVGFILSRDLKMEGRRTRSCSLLANIENVDFKRLKSSEPG